jgi:hypothetical protein
VHGGPSIRVKHKRIIPFAGASVFQSTGLFSLCFVRVCGNSSYSTSAIIAVNSVLETKPQATTAVKCAPFWLLSIFAVTGIVPNDVHSSCQADGEQCQQHQSGPQVTIQEIVRLHGEEKRFGEITLQEARPAILQHGVVAAAEELDEVCAEMRRIAEDKTTLVVLARVTQVWARKE